MLESGDMCEQIMEVLLRGIMLALGSPHCGLCLLEPGQGIFREVPDLGEVGELRVKCRQPYPCRPPLLHALDFSLFVPQRVHALDDGSAFNTYLCAPCQQRVVRVSILADVQEPLVRIFKLPPNVLDRLCRTTRFEDGAHAVVELRHGLAEVLDAQSRAVDRRRNVRIVCGSERLQLLKIERERTTKEVGCGRTQQARENAILRR
jgi:hypothetical protein